MLKDKIILTDDLKRFIKRTREDNGLILNDFDKKIKHSVTWLNQVEGKRIKSIRRSDLIEIFQIILNSSEEEAECYIENYLNENKQAEEKNDFEKLLYSMLVDKFPNTNEINIIIKEKSITITTIKNVLL